MNRAVITLLAIALLLRLLISLRLPTSDASLAALPDQLEYLQSGRNLLHGGGLSFVDPRFAQRVFAYRMPGYPLLIAACGGKVIVIRVLQCLLDTSAVFAVFLLARRWLDSKFALLAATLVAINPFQIYFCGLILSETLFIALMTWGVTLLAPPAAFGLRHSASRTPSPQPSPRLQGGGGRFLAVAMLIAGVLARPSATLLPVLFSVVTRRWRLLILAIIFEALLLTAWAWRNHAVLGEWIFTTTNSGISAYDGLNPAATGASDQRFVAAMPELQSMTETQRNRYLGELANRFARAHPLQVLKLAGIKLARLWSPIPLSEEYGSNLKLVAVSLIYSLPLDILILVGLFFGDLPRSAKLFLVTPAVYFSLVHAVGVGSLRYRIPADVPMTVIAASGIAVCSRKWYGQTSADA